MARQTLLPEHVRRNHHLKTRWGVSTTTMVVVVVVVAAAAARCRLEVMWVGVGLGCSVSPVLLSGEQRAVEAARVLLNHKP